MISNIIINSVSDAPERGYVPSQVIKAYNLSQLGKGNGVSVAVVDFIGNPYIENNLRIFSERFNLSKANTEIIGEQTNTDFNFSAYIEATVDSQWVHAISEQAKIYIIKAPSYTTEGAISAVNEAKNAGADVILLTFQTSMNQSLFENSAIFDYDGIFVASAGDFGAEANFPACVPNCIAVGGTRLEISSDGERMSTETVWEGTGGGICTNFNIPVFQRNMAGISEITGGKRGVPDVSFLASPEPGFSVYHSSTGGSFGWYSVGGTSIAASCVAGIMANILSSERFEGVTGRNIHTFLYELAGGDSYKNEYSKFIDITEGNNGEFFARPGYDLCTGLGSLYGF